MKLLKFPLLIILLSLLFSSEIFAASSAVTSVETPYNIYYVREATMSGEKCIVASGYDGEIMLISYDGTIKWEKDLSGYLNHDVCCYDLDGDGNDEILCANADGTLYVLDENGDDLWSFRANEIPLYSVTALECNDQVVVAVGGFDKNIYFLTTSNNLMHTIESHEYATTAGWGDIGYEKRGSINFLRRFKNDEGKDLLAVHGTMSSHNGGGGFYVMDVDPKNKKYDVLLTVSKVADNPIGYCSINSNEAGGDRVVLGITASGNPVGFVDIDCNSGDKKEFTFGQHSYAQLNGQFLNFGYRICHAQAVKGLQPGYDYNYITYTGTTIMVLRPDLTFDKTKDIISGRDSYNDMYVDQENMKMIVSSSQSGGNCVHIVDLTDKDWMKDMATYTPAGNITKILQSSAALKTGAENFVQPSWEAGRPVVHLMSEFATNDAVKGYLGKYRSLDFLSSVFDNQVQDPESWSRDTMTSTTYKDARHARQYVLDADEAVAAIVNNYPGMPGYNKISGADFPENTGSSYWGGHGADPFYYSPTTWLTALREAKDRKSVPVFTEMLTGERGNIDYLFQTLWIPMANLRKEGVNVNVNISMHGIFWMTEVHTPNWSPLVSGKYADALVPGMEETSARNQDVSLAARVGLWASGSVDQWGSGCARDNASYDRQRQNSHQTLPNHFLRHMIYHISYGARYLNNFAVDQQYMTLLWDMIGKGLIYVPKKEELISISPVYLAMEEPDKDLLVKEERHKWTILQDAETVGDRDPFVVDKLSSAWCSAPVNEWDYSNYAAKVPDRRQNFLAPFPNGLVLFSSAEESNKYRANLSQQLHPIYRDIMKSYHTDGRDYIINGERKAADEYYKVIEADIKESAKKLPVTVGDGEVAWVAAHSGPRHIRLTIIDGSYVNADDAHATITFNTVNPVSITDLVTGEKVMTNGEKQFEMMVPMGGARFLDVELEEDLQ